ncbi:threonine-phosphate decarboxylase CobD [Paenibacillus sp. J2TS4]|uniref:threonine-phosphate decarboxylase CobD n=1 Tax=Paenibacillus sp. J2TS4 TaxID=2807194 RepID=UPI001B2E1582|nr:threonine-phosphate decarboxylase CobD [Paenibacillus sp. J2TS4]GIP34363.1 threonine-phosphate decarboxylase [Paenibacillus sp. J2TS4]
MIEKYGHGGDLLTAQESFGLSGDEFVDFSSNMNPFGPPDAVERIIMDYARHLIHYPDPGVRELRKKLASVYRVPEESVLVGNGAAECIDLAARVLQPRVTGLARPCFSEYEEAVMKTGGRIHDLPLRPENQFELMPDDVLAALDYCDTLFLGHPNNPTGQLLNKETIAVLMESGREVIVDEAFIDFAPEEEAISLIRQAPVSEHLIVIRSMTKFYAVPGIRLGFAVAHPRTVEAMRRLQIPWSVNSLAQRIGTAVLEEQEYAVRTKAWLQTEREWLSAKLSELGMNVYPSDTNFLLFSIPERLGMKVKELQSRMGTLGLLIRDASLFPGLDTRHCRIAVRLRKDNERLLSGLHRVLEDRK